MFTGIAPSRSIRANLAPINGIVARYAHLVVLGVALITQALLALFLRNTAFQDEALYLYAGRQYLEMLAGGPGPSENYASFFSGLPYVYPVIGAVADVLAGLEGARLLSLIFMLATTVIIFGFTRSLFGTTAAAFATFAFATQGSALFLTHFATHDAMVLAMTAATLAVAEWTARRSSPLPSAAFGLLLVLTFVTKYVSLMFFPALVAYFIWRRWHLHGRKSAAFGLLAAVGTIAGIGLLLLPTINGGPIRDIIDGFLFSTDRTTRIFVDLDLLLGRTLGLIGPLFIIAAIGLLYGNRTIVQLGVGLIATALIVPAYHLAVMEVLSLHKHLAFSALFLAPLAGFAMERWFRHQRFRLFLVGTALIALATFGFTQAQKLFADWPNSDALVTYLQQNIKPGQNLLVEDSEVPRYYLQDETTPGQWKNLYYLEYRTPDGTLLLGDDAYVASIKARDFDWVVLRFNSEPERGRLIEQTMLETRIYEKVATLPFDTSFAGSGAYSVWKKR